MTTTRDDNPIGPADLLACPTCEYSLRGLRGRVVRCPECGVACDRLTMITNEWTGPWYHAPGYARLQIPVTLLMMAGGFGVGAMASGSPVVTVAAIVSLGGWLLSVWRVRHDLSDGMAIPLSLLAHVIIAGYFLPVVVTILLFLSAPMLGVFASLIAFTLLVLGVALVLWLCRKGERFIAGRCIAEHLQRAASGDN